MVVNISVFLKRLKINMLTKCPLMRAPKQVALNLICFNVLRYASILRKYPLKQVLDKLTLRLVERFYQLIKNFC